MQKTKSVVSSNILKGMAISAYIIVACMVLNYTDGVLDANYWVKSGIKIILFLVAPLAFMLKTDLQATRDFLKKPTFKQLKVAIILGVSCVIMVLLGYFFIVQKFVEEDVLLASLTSGSGITSTTFLPVSVYISLVNSFIEEFFFRCFGFLLLRRYVPSWVALLFSSTCFSVYHIGIIFGWFNIFLFMLAILGLVAVGAFFCYLVGKQNSLYPSWVVHMMANVGINIIGFVIFATVSV